MMPPAYVKAYVRRQKNDAADAAAICEAVSRPSMRFLAVRSVTNQAELMRHKGVNWHFFNSPVTGLGGPSQPLLNALQPVGRISRRRNPPSFFAP
jgi:hypothetical protein